MIRTRNWLWLVLAALAFTVAVVSTAVAQGPRGPKPSDRPTTVFVGEQPVMPPGLAEATRRRAEADAKGVDLPMPVWDETTGDVVLDENGRPVMNDRLRFDPKTGKLVRDANGRPIVGPPSRVPAPFEPCGITPEGCGR